MIRVALLLSLLAAPAFGGTFYALDANFVDGISADGSVVLARRTFAPKLKGPERGQAVLWTRQKAKEVVPPTLSDGFQGNDLSADGSTVAGQFWHYQSGSFSDSGAAWSVDGFKFQGGTPLDAVSGDGTKVSRENILVDASGETALPFRITDISADGQTVVGFGSDLRPYRWNGASAPIGNPLAVDAKVSADGSIVYVSPPSGTASRWTEQTGAVAVPGFSFITGVSSNGLYAAGFGSPVNDEGETRVITPDGVINSGAWGDGWALLLATAVSDDGLTIAGYGRPPGGGRWQAWVYDRGATWLPGDANRDGRVDLADFGTLKANFGSGRSWSYGDFDGSGRIDLADFGILKSQFGVAAPEPGTLNLAAAGLLIPMIAAARRRTLRRNATD
ncbi:MAG: hypothetical protein U0836_20135 [Pirellulales bacterium]